MTIKPIKTIEDYQAALTRIEQLWNAHPNTLEGDELDVLTTLVHTFKQEHYQIEAPDPIEAIKFRMEQQGLEEKDLVPYLGQHSRVTEIMNRKRELSISMIRNLHKGLHIPLSCLISEYKLSK